MTSETKSETTTTVVSNWVKKQLAKLNINDEGKFSLFNDYAIKQYHKNISNGEKAIAICERKLEALKIKLDDTIQESNEELDELQEQLLDATSAQPENVASLDARKEFFDTLNERLDAVDAKIAAKELAIGALYVQYDIDCGTESDKINENRMKMAICNKRIELLK